MRPSEGTFLFIYFERAFLEMLSEKVEAASGGGAIAPMRIGAGEKKDVAFLHFSHKVTVTK